MSKFVTDATVLEKLCFQSMQEIRFLCLKQAVTVRFC